MYSPTYEKRIQSLRESLPFIDTRLIYQERAQMLKDGLIKPAQVKNSEIYKAIRHNCKLLKENRQGEYLIKRNTGWSDKLMCQWGNGYIDYTFKGERDAWHSWGNRSNAQWFTKQEVKEFLDNFPKGFKVVKR